ncbi:MAG: hypothetical protein INR62_06340 [Rhodospirillales bacterium]|nr:hypothetical protein [Acetobacter sp.]
MPPTDPPASQPALRPATDDLAGWCVPLPRVATFTQWLAGRAGRRKLCERLGGERPLRRQVGNPAKDAVLRALHAGERGAPFASTAQLEAQSQRARAALRLPAR